MNLIETARLYLRELTTDDAAFMLKLMNDPTWLRFIGDRNIKTISDAEAYIANKLAPSYKQFGFGFYLTKLRKEGTPIGICGLIKRPTLEHVDVGFAFMPEHRGKGFGFESASAVLDYAKNDLGIKYIIAITDLDNVPSIKLLEKLGLKFEKMMKLDEKDDKQCRLFVPQNK